MCDLRLCWRHAHLTHSPKSSIRFCVIAFSENTWRECSSGLISVVNEGRRFCCFLSSMARTMSSLTMSRLLAHLSTVSCWSWCCCSWLLDQFIDYAAPFTKKSTFQFHPQPFFFFLHFCLLKRVWNLEKVSTRSNLRYKSTKRIRREWMKYVMFHLSACVCIESDKTSF